MKVSLMISSLSSGGAERVATTLANYWISKDWKISIITLAGLEQDFFPLSPKIKRICLNKVGKSTGFHIGLSNNMYRLLSLRNALKQEKPDIVLGFMASSNILCGLACHGITTTAVGSEHIHPPMAPLDQPRAILRRLIYPRLSAVSALTQESAAWINTNTRARLVPVIPNPITYPMPHGEPVLEPASIKKKLGGKKLLLAVGRLAHQKAFDRLLEAFSHIRNTHPQWRLVILGEGPLRRDLEQRQQQLGLHKVVAMPGAVGNLGAWYDASDAYVMTSRFEGFGNTLAEALAYGLPCIAVDCPSGPREILRHEVDGFLVPQNDLDALVSALDKLMGDSLLRARLASRAVEARERFAVEQVAGRWEALFTQILNHSSR